MFYSHSIFQSNFFLKICILDPYIIHHKTINNITIKMYTLIKSCGMTGKSIGCYLDGLTCLETTRMTDKNII